MPIMDALRQDLRYAFRALRRAPAITALVVGSLGLAIAGNTTVFSILNGLMLRPMPYHEPDRIAWVGEYQDPALAGQVNGASAGNFLDWRERQESFSALAAVSIDFATLSTSAGAAAAGERGEPVVTASATPELFGILGVEPQQGRGFLAEEGAPGAASRSVVLDHRAWVTRFASDPSVLGRSVVVNGKAHTIVGVLPESFQFLDPRIELWRPLALDPTAVPRDRRELLVVARLAPGVTTAQAGAAMAALGQRLAAEHPETNRGYVVETLNMQEQSLSAQDRQLLGLLQGALVFVLLIACANVANLFLVRTQGRVTELAVRSSLGAGRARIARQLTTEAVVAAAGGGLLGLGLGWLATRAVADAMSARLPSFWLPTIDGRVVLFTAGISVVAGLLVGSLPAFQAGRMKLQETLKEGGRGGSLGGRRRLASRILVVAEIALSLVLLGGGAVLVRGFLQIQNVDPGFDTASLATLRVELPEAGDASATERTAALAEVVRRLESLPGVDAVAASSIRPRTPMVGGEPYAVDGAPTAEGEAAPSVATVAVGPGFFEMLRVPVAAGRGFDASDRPGTAPVAIVNRKLADKHWPGADPIGRTITSRGEARRIVGVVPNLRHAVFVEAVDQPELYLSLAQEAPTSAAVTLRATGDPAALAKPVRDALTSYDRGLVLTPVQPLDEFTEQFFVGMKVMTSILAAFGTLALLLAALGTYGVLAYSVAQRTHEIGVRMALGARAGEVRGMVSRQGLVLAGLGIGIGVPGVIGVARLVGSTMAGLGTVEPLAVVVMAAVLAAVTLLASWMPARRAAAVDPAIALRGE
jgi:putative ABC transport system permease protein